MPIHCNTNTHAISLRFKIDRNASQKYINNWIKFKNVCESGNNKEIVKNWLSNCKINSIKDMPYLYRSEGGIGGCNDLIHKQIRFRQHLLYLKDNDILFDIYNSDKEEWLLEELDDLIRAFIIIANIAICAECVNGCIEIVSNEIFSIQMNSNEMNTNDLISRIERKIQGIELQVRDIDTKLEKLLLMLESKANTLN
jgi:hypothetical protein